MPVAVTGKVVDESNRAVAGAKLWTYRRLDESGHGSGSAAETLADGRFRLDPLILDQTFLRVDGPGLATRFVQADAAEKTITLSPGADLDLRLVVEKGALKKGRRIEVRLPGDPFWWTPRDRYSEDKTTRIPGLRPGPVRVRVKVLGSGATAETEVITTLERVVRVELRPVNSSSR